MKISLFYEIPSRRPWSPEKEVANFEHHLELLEVADQAGFHAVWVTEHHFMEEYCAASAPEVFLGAASQRTKRIRLGHGIMHLPPQINHPARAAERIATLDVLSNGRVEFGSGEASSVAELAAFGVDAGRKREAWREGLEVAARMMAENPFSGYKGEFVDVPPRQLVPQVVQRPHPPMWVACTRRSTLEVAAGLGLGALHFAVAGPSDIVEARKVYFDAFEDATPLTPTANPNFLCLGGGLFCADTDELANERALVPGGFYGYGISYYYVHGMHKPGQVDLWGDYVQSLQREESTTAQATAAGATEGDRADWANLVDSVKQDVANGLDAARGMVDKVSPIGSPETIAAFLRSFEETGVEEICFLVPPVDDPNWNVESLRMLGEQVLPEFIEREKQAALDRAPRNKRLVDAAVERYKAGPQPPELDPEYAFGGPPVAFDGKSSATEILEALNRAAEVAKK